NKTFWPGNWSAVESASEWANQTKAEMPATSVKMNVSRRSVFASEVEDATSPALPSRNDSVDLGSAGSSPAVCGLWPQTFCRDLGELFDTSFIREEQPTRRRPERPGRSRSHFFIECFRPSHAAIARFNRAGTASSAMWSRNRTNTKLNSAPPATLPRLSATYTQPAAWLGVLPSGGW